VTVGVCSQSYTPFHPNTSSHCYKHQPGFFTYFTHRPSFLGTIISFLLGFLTPLPKPAVNIPDLYPHKPWQLRIQHQMLQNN
jgi:hypothetical protein